MDNHVGQQLGNYQLLRILGQGGFATVYLGEHIHLGTQAAVKVLNIQAESRTGETFRTEARIIAHLEHPHIIHILDFGIERTIPFLVMSYAPGGTLYQRHPKGTCLPLGTIASYVREIAPALQYAHDENVIHRDIKPENILLDRRNNILLSDFGIALTLPQTGTLGTQVMAGTVTYMAPEQIKGKPRFASDQYALGIIMYEWIAGTSPFLGSQWEVMNQHMHASPPPLHEKIPSIPLAVEEVVLRALSKEPHQRFAHVQDFAAAFEQAIQHSVQSSSTLSFNALSSSIVPALLSGFTLSQAPQSTLPTSFSSLPSPQYDEVSRPYDTAPLTFAPPLTSQQPINSMILPDHTLQQSNMTSLQDQFFINQAVPSNQPSSSPPGVGPSTQMQQPNPRQLIQQHPPPVFQQFPGHMLQQEASTKKSQKEIGRSRRVALLLTLLLILALSGVTSYFAIKQGNTPPSGLSTATTPSPSISPNTPTRPIQLGYPLLSTYHFIYRADGKTSYTFLAQATDRSASYSPLQGKPVHASGITCRLWLEKADNPNNRVLLSEARLRDVNSLTKPLSNEVVGILLFDPTTPETHLCDAQGQGKWIYQVSPAANPGEYSLVILTDWDGYYYNWSWMRIIVKAP